MSGYRNFCYCCVSSILTTFRVVLGALWIFLAPHGMPLTRMFTLSYCFVRLLKESIVYDYVSSSGNKRADCHCSMFPWDIVLHIWCFVCCSLLIKKRSCIAVILPLLYASHVLPITITWSTSQRLGSLYDCMLINDMSSCHIEASCVDSLIQLLELLNGNNVSKLTCYSIFGWGISYHYASLFCLFVFVNTC